MLIKVMSDKYLHPKMESTEVEILMKVYNQQYINDRNDFVSKLIKLDYINCVVSQVVLFNSTYVLTDKGLDWVENFEKLPLQTRITVWSHVTFNLDILDKMERAYRFCEESLELVQSVGVPREDLHKLIDYVYNREPGEKKQEIGGVVTTLAILASVHDLSVEECATKELDRIWTRIDEIRKKQETKPKASPLQGSAD